MMIYREYNLFMENQVAMENQMTMENQHMAMETHTNQDQDQNQFAVFSKIFSAYLDDHNFNQLVICLLR